MAKPDKDSLDPAKILAESKAALWDRDGVFLVPVRHHSPACAWNVRQLIRDIKPAAVLIEGPHEFDPLIPLCLAPETKAPFAIYCATERGKGEETTRAAAFYPLCDYSPELVALREGQAIGAESRFIDISFRDKAWMGQTAPDAPAEEDPDSHEGEAPPDPDPDPGPDPDEDRLVSSLLEENYLAHSRYLNALARRSGCRDHNELWDHLFELRPHRLPGLRPEAGDWRAFFEEVSAYCLMARLDYDPEALEAEGNLPRERFMASCIHAAREDMDGPIVVVTGGFHTQGLIELLGRKTKPGKKASPGGGHGAYLVRYSFDRLDALNGYGAGMPSPAYYQMLWERMTGEDASNQGTSEGGNSTPLPNPPPQGGRELSPDPWTATAAALFLELGQHTRARGDGLWLSTADTQSALRQALDLARLRGHMGPGREDTLDAIRSCFVKGAIDEEGRGLMAEVYRVLCGDRMGNIPASAGSPPLVENARQRAEKFRLKLDSTMTGSARLDIYRKARHRETSRFFHAMGYLETGFARLEGGPDFTTGRGLDLLFENWSYSWSPTVEASLIDNAVYGETVEAAVLNRLLEQQKRMESEGEGRSARAAIGLLLKACQMGLQDRLPRLFGLIGRAIAEDPSFGSIVASAQDLLLLWQAREPLGVQHRAEIPDLLAVAYRRAVYLLPDLRNLKDPDARAAANDLIALRDILVSAEAQDGDLLDKGLFHDALERLSETAGAQPFLAGAASGLLFLDGVYDEEELNHRVAGTLDGALGNAAAQVAFLAGLMTASRELLWRLPSLLERLNHIVSGWDANDFLDFLPQLRLAFTSLTPRECDRIARAVAGLNGGGEADLVAPVSYDVGEDELMHNLAIDVRLKEALERDGLAEWARGGDTARETGT